MLFHGPEIKLHYTDKAQRLFNVIGVTPPDSPTEAFRSLMSFRNETCLHRRKCDFTGDEIISAYSKDTPFPVYKNDVWWGDQWNPLEFGRDFDFSKPFFEQFAELQKVVPREGTSVFFSENCDYNGHIRESKNCYMNALIHGCEDTHYSYWCVGNKDVVDSHVCNDSTLAYECIDCKNVYECVYCQECVNTRNCYFSYQLLGCENCIGCSNLTRKKYHIFNKPVSKEEFLALKDKILNGSQETWSQGVEFYNKMFAAANHRTVHNLNSENCTGDHIFDSKNCHMSFDVFTCEDVNYSISSADSHDICFCYSAGWPSCEEIYMSCVTRGSSNIAFCYYTFYSSGLRYCDQSMNLNDSFGCIGLRQKQFCVLNKQYSKEDYLKLSAKIIEHMKKTGEWGQFFPPSITPFPYNETAASGYIPLSKQEALSRGYRWNDERDLNSDPPKDAKPTNSYDQALNTIHCCRLTGKKYKIIPNEFEFYQSLKLPIPHLGPEARRQARVLRRNPYRLFVRQCATSGGKILSSFLPEHTGKVLSEEEYLKSVE